jgi:hypothetical protein
MSNEADEAKSTAPPASSDEAPRARARRRENSPTDEKRARVFLIAKLMACGEWKGTSSEEALATEWNRALSTVQGMAAEASRLLEWTTNDRALLIKLGRLRLQEIAAEDGNDRVQAVNILFQSLGALQHRAKVEHTGPGGGPIRHATGVVVLPEEDDSGDAGTETDGNAASSA